MGTPSRRKRTGVASTGVKAPLASLRPLPHISLSDYTFAWGCALCSARCLFMMQHIETVNWTEDAMLWMAVLPCRRQY